MPEMPSLLGESLRVLAAEWLAQLVAGVSLRSDGWRAARRSLRPGKPGVRVTAWLLFSIFCCVFPSVSLSHDLWILPGKFRLLPGERVRIFVNNGDEFPESTTLVGSHRIAELRFIHQDGNQAISEFNIDARSLTFDVRGPSAGDSLLALSIEPRTVRMPAEEFLAYLEEEGEEELAGSFEERPPHLRAARERYHKFAKSLLVGRPAAAAEADSAVKSSPEPSLWLTPLGQGLELVPLEGPDGFLVDSEIGFQLLRHGEALRGARVTGGRAGGTRVEMGQTDESGRLHFTFPEAGRWYVRAIHLSPPAEDEEASHDGLWESLWATLTFEIEPSVGSP